MNRGSRRYESRLAPLHCRALGRRLDLSAKKSQVPVVSRKTTALDRSPQGSLGPGSTVDWARRLAAEVGAIMEAHPEAEPENIRRALISLQSPPLERLNRSLRRGRGFAAFRR